MKQGKKKKKFGKEGGRGTIGRENGRGVPRWRWRRAAERGATQILLVLCLGEVGVSSAVGTGVGGSWSWGGREWNWGGRGFDVIKKIKLVKQYNLERTD